MKTSVLWQKLLDSRQTEDIYGVLHELLVCGQLNSSPPAAADILLGLLDEIHEPQVWLLTCVLVGQLCNLTSVARTHLAQRGALSSLAGVLKRCLSSLTFITTSSLEGRMYEQLVKFVMSMLQYFSFGASVCIRKILQDDILGTVLSAVDCNTSALYVFGSVESEVQLRSLLVGRSMVGRRIWAPSASTCSAYDRLLGCDVADLLGADMPAQDSFIVDLYDTNSDEDIHIIEQLPLSCVSSAWKSLSENVDGEWVDVYITCVLDGGHFVAVFGAEQVEQFHELCENVEAAVAKHSMSLSCLPSRGQLVCVSHPELGGFRAYVVNADSSEKIITFAPDCGYVEEVPLSYLSTLDDCTISFPSVSPVHVCKLMGECTLCLTTVVAYHVCQVLFCL